MTPSAAMLRRLVDHLEAARRLVTDPARWMPDDASCFARDVSSRSCAPGSSLAAAWTWDGALIHTATRAGDVAVAIDYLGGRRRPWRRDHGRCLEAFDAAIRTLDPPDPPEPGDAPD
jgi:hypothetical protein